MCRTPDFSEKYPNLFFATQTHICLCLNFFYNFQFIYGVNSSILDFSPFQFLVVALWFSGMDSNDDSWIALILYQSEGERKKDWADFIFCFRAIGDRFYNDISRSRVQCVSQQCGTFAMPIVLSIVRHMWNASQQNRNHQENMTKDNNLNSMFTCFTVLNATKWDIWYFNYSHKTEWNQRRE